MIKQVLNLFNASLFMEIALVMFALVFIAIVIHTLMMGSDTTKQQANIVLGDKTEKHS